MKESKLLTPNTIKGKEEQLQFMRFLAFLNVYIAHAEVWLFFDYPASHCSKAAVSFFFILSGGLTGYSGYGKEVRLSASAFGSYMWKKLRKLYPLYFLTMTLPLVLSNLPGQIVSGDFALAWPQLRQLIKNLLLIQSWFAEGYFSINGVGWFLSTLMFLYLWNLPALWLLNQGNRHPRRFILLFSGFCAVFFGTVAYCYVTQPYDMDYLQYVLPPARLGEYFCGMILGFGIAAGKPHLREGTANKAIFTVLEVGALAFWFLSLGRPGNYWMNRIVSWLIPNLLLFGVFLIGKGWVSQAFRWKPLVRLGDVSFECFLIHNILIIRFLQYNEAYLTSRLGKILAFCTCLIFSLLLAFLLHREGRTGDKK